MSGEVLIPVSVGELFDKISILEIKQERLSDPAKLDNVRRELTLLREIAAGQAALAAVDLAAVLRARPIMIRGGVEWPGLR